MTTHTYLATFKRLSDGVEFHGSIFWDKYSPSTLKVNLSRMLAGNVLDYALWEGERQGISPNAQSSLIEALKARAETEGLEFVGEELTEYSPRI